jgi:hypothetical protein
MQKSNKYKGGDNVMATATAQVEDQQYELVQFEDSELEQALDPARATVRAHGNFRVGQIKESELIYLHKIESANEIEQEIESFLSSGSRIVVINTDMCLPVTRFMFSSTLLKLSQFSPSYRRVIVREYDGILYLARRAFWNGPRLPIEFSPELSMNTKQGLKIRQQNEKVREIRQDIEHMSVLTPDQLDEIKDWENSENVIELTTLLSHMMKQTFA